MNNKTNSDTLYGKVCLITGGARGIGASIAEHIANAGAAAVVITDVLDSDGEKLATILNEKYLSKVIYIHQDVTEEKTWNQTIKKVVTQTGGLDILVNNAGIEHSSLLENFDFLLYKQQQAVNEDGVFLGCREAVRAMKPGGIAGKGGSIINISSIAAMMGVPGYSAYGGTKGFIRIISKHLAVECGKLGYGIRVNSIYPGVIKTKMGAKVFSDLVRMGLTGSVKEAEKLFIQNTPLGKLGCIDDIAASTVYLASDEAKFVTGLEMVIDGGITAA